MMENPLFFITRKMKAGSLTTCPVSSILSEIYIQNIQDLILYYVQITHKIRIHISYVDDILVIFYKLISIEHDIIFKNLTPL